LVSAECSLDVIQTNEKKEIGAEIGIVPILVLVLVQSPVTKIDPKEEIVVGAGIEEAGIAIKVGAKVRAVKEKIGVKVKRKNESERRIEIRTNIEIERRIVIGEERETVVIEEGAEREKIETVAEAERKTNETQNEIVVENGVENEIVLENVRENEIEAEKRKGVEEVGKLIPTGDVLTMMHLIRNYKNQATPWFRVVQLVVQWVIRRVVLVKMSCQATSMLSIQARRVLCTQTLTNNHSDAYPGQVLRAELVLCLQQV